MEFSPFLYKTFILIVSASIIVYFLPLNTQYSIQFSEGKRWTGNTLYAPFDFPIIKSAEELLIEKQSIESKSILYFDINADISRLESIGAVLAEGPIEQPNGMQIAFIKTPGNVRLELIQWPD